MKKQIIEGKETDLWWRKIIKKWKLPFYHTFRVCPYLVQIPPEQTLALSGTDDLLIVSNRKYIKVMTSGWSLEKYQEFFFPKNAVNTWQYYSEIMMGPTHHIFIHNIYIIGIDSPNTSHQEIVQIYAPRSRIKYYKEQLISIYLQIYCMNLYFWHHVPILWQFLGIGYHICTAQTCLLERKPSVLSKFTWLEQE